MTPDKLDLAEHDLSHLADFQRRHRVGLMCMVCTDLPHLPRLSQDLGDAEALRIIRQHNQILRALLAGFPGGLEINGGAGTFFLVFDKPSDAVRFLLRLQIQMGRLERTLGRELSLRAGVHVGEVLVEQDEDTPRPRELNGLQVDTCLELRSMADPGHILLSRFAFDNARLSLKASPLPEPHDLRWVSHGTFELLVVGGMIEVCEVAPRPGPPVRPPRENERVRHAPGEPESIGLDEVSYGSETTILHRMLVATPAVRRPALVGALITSLLGALFLVTGWLDSASYDLAYLFRPRVTPDEVVVVEMDRESHLRLNQPTDDKWDRGLHAALLARLQAAGAKAVGFDIAFAGPARTNTEDLAFAAALRTFGHTVLGAAVEVSSSGRTTIFAPLPALREAARWGIVERAPDGTSVRQHFEGFDGRPSMGEVLSEVASGGKVSAPAGAWLNYYGPPGSIPHRSFVSVLSNEVPAGVFSNRVVFVGANENIGYSGKAGTDYLSTPYTRWTGLKSPGVEINATSYANLVRHEWLRRLPMGIELLAVLLAGALAGYTLGFWDPPRSVTFGLLAALVLGLGLMAQVWVTHIWFPWLVTCAIQLPVAVTWAVMMRTRSLVAEDRKLRKYLAARRTGSAPNPVPAPDVAAGGTRIMSPGEQARLGVNAAVPTVPDHDMLKCVGQGSYGEVWLARDIIGSYHAVKLLRRSAFKDDAPFEREFKGLQHYTPISRSHPGLVHILHVGRNDAAGFIYYMMEAGDDESRGSEIAPNSYSPRNLGNDIERRGGLPFRELVGVAIAITESLAFLHGRGLVHRDLKPANIIFVHGRPKLADVGLVTRIATPGSEITFVGTHGYMPPEGPGAPSADLFSLGRLLYVAATGHPVQNFPKFPHPPAGIPDGTRIAEFHSLLLRACDPIVTNRYQTADEFLLDLRALQARMDELA